MRQIFFDRNFTSGLQWHPTPLQSYSILFRLGNRVPRNNRSLWLNLASKIQMTCPMNTRPSSTHSNTIENRQTRCLRKAHSHFNQHHNSPKDLTRRTDWHLLLLHRIILIGHLRLFRRQTSTPTTPPCSPPNPLNRLRRPNSLIHRQHLPGRTEERPRTVHLEPQTRPYSVP